MQAAKQHAGSAPTTVRPVSAMPPGVWSRITFYSEFQFCRGEAALFHPGPDEADLWLRVTPEQAEVLRTAPPAPSGWSPTWSGTAGGTSFAAP